MFDSDTYALPESPEIARLAAGGMIDTINAVLSGEADNGLVAVRPPGHHATPDRAMGFCLLNNIAIGARHAQAEHDIKRVMIVDIDVHHGNGTQDIFYDDDSVFFLSTHQAPPFYPGTGAEADTGTGAGKGATLNIPLPTGVGDAGYQILYDELIRPAAERFKPELLLVSAGFDAHFVDPLAQMKLSLAGYAHICRELKSIADALCNGRVIFVMEGGYDLKAIGHGMQNIAHVLLDDDTISDPYGAHDTREPDLSDLIARLQERHNL
jgi:acetoin utilization deacetylase AcuC-like enzyme